MEAPPSPARCLPIVSLLLLRSRGAAGSAAGFGLRKAVSQAGGVVVVVSPRQRLPGVRVCGRGSAGSRQSLPRIVSPLPPALLREEVAQLQEEVHLLRQMKEMLTKDLEETHGSKSPEVLSATELKVQLAQKEQELARAKEALQGKGCASLFWCTSPRDPKVSRS